MRSFHNDKKVKSYFTIWKQQVGVRGVTLDWKGSFFIRLNDQRTIHAKTLKKASERESSMFKGPEARHNKWYYWKYGWVRNKRRVWARKYRKLGFSRGKEDRRPLTSKLPVAASSPIPLVPFMILTKEPDQWFRPGRQRRSKLWWLPYLTLPARWGTSF